MEHQPAREHIQRLSIHLAPHADGSVITAVGELDHDTAPLLLHSLERALADHVGSVVVECTGITFCDSSGLNVFLRTRRTAANLERALILVEPSRALHRVLRLTGAEPVFDIAPTLEAAFGI